MRAPLPDPLAPDTCQVALSLDRSRLGAFGGLLQAGVAVPVREGCTVARFLTHELGISPRVVAERVTTVFLDGKVVDDLEQAVLRPGASLALSAAMPGLVGATLRRGGAYSAMRAEITHGPDVPGAGERSEPGFVHLKLFNLLVAELGPAVLGHGIVLGASEAAEALPSCPDLAAVPPARPVHLRVSFHEEPTCR